MQVLRIKLIACIILLCILATLSGCTTGHRGEPLPEELKAVAQIPGIQHARVWGDEPLPYENEWINASEADLKRHCPGIMNTKHTYLAVSGGGSNGAFGAGLLAGWSAQGTRPEFTVVTGISTGSLIAPFAFLGPEYDAQLKEVYTTYGTNDLMKKVRLGKMRKQAGLLDVQHLKNMIGKYYGEEVLNAIAREAKKGRSLLVGTSNLDAARLVIWDIGMIAMSDAPNRVELVQDILLASCSIPGGFPPVYFEVEANGKIYDEMHADGGCSSQVFLSPSNMDWAGIIKRLNVQGTPTTYVIRNSRLEPRWDPVEPRLTSIAGRAINSLIRTQGIGDMYRIYLKTRRDGQDFNLAYIPPEFTLRAEEFWDMDYMQALYAFGYEKASKGYPWEKVPPGFEGMEEQWSVTETHKQ